MLSTLQDKATNLTGTHHHPKHQFLPPPVYSDSMGPAYGCTVATQPDSSDSTFPNTWPPRPKTTKGSDPDQIRTAPSPAGSQTTRHPHLKTCCSSFTHYWVYILELSPQHDCGGDFHQKNLKQFTTTFSGGMRGRQINAGIATCLDLEKITDIKSCTDVIGFKWLMMNVLSNQQSILFHRFTQYNYWSNSTTIQPSVFTFLISWQYCPKNPRYTTEIKSRNV